MWAITCLVVGSARSPLANDQTTSSLPDNGTMPSHPDDWDDNPARSRIHRVRFRAPVLEPFPPLQGPRHRILERGRRQHRREIPRSWPEGRARRQAVRGDGVAVASHVGRRHRARSERAEGARGRGEDHRQGEEGSQQGRRQQEDKQGVHLGRTGQARRCDRCRQGVDSGEFFFLRSSSPSLAQTIVLPSN